MTDRQSFFFASTYAASTGMPELGINDGSSQEEAWREQMQKTEPQAWRNPSPVPRHRPGLFRTLWRLLLAGVAGVGLFAVAWLAL